MDAGGAMQQGGGGQQRGGQQRAAATTAVAVTLPAADLTAKVNAEGKWVYTIDSPQ
jgi:hypothetical protein